jgi:hypothetical protein
MLVYVLDKLCSRLSSAWGLKTRCVAHPTPACVVTLTARVLKVGHVTCDNASNNWTMMREFAAHLKVATGKNYDWKQRKIK